MDKKKLTKENVTVGTIWRSKVNGLKCKVVAIRPNISQPQNGAIVEVEYSDGNGGFKPSILPATWCINHWAERFDALPEGDDVAHA